MPKQQQRVARREMGYNGYANYETWTLSVWEYITFLKDEAVDMGMSGVTAEWCQETIYDILDISRLDGIISDWVNAAMNEIDWREVAEMVNSGDY